MNQKFRTILFLSVIALIISAPIKGHAQCTWKNIVYDSFEYQTPCPDVLAGVVYTTVPQTWIAHTGTRAL